MELVKGRVELELFQKKAKEIKRQKRELRRIEREQREEEDKASIEMISEENFMEIEYEQQE